MIPERVVARPARRWMIALSAVLLAMTAVPAHALRIVSYNILNYPGPSGPTRDPRFRTVLGTVGADMVVNQEMQSQAGVDAFRNNVLNTLEPGQWASAPFVNGNDTDNALHYKPSKWQFLGGWSFYPNPATNLRLVNVYRMKPVGYASGAAEVRIYSLHLKASQGFETDRLNEAIGIRDSMNAMPPGTHAICLGDYNIYSGNESGYLKFLESQVNNVGRLYDPLGPMPGTWNSASYVQFHTQSPCLSGGATCASGAATGGVDDRFDLFLPTLNLNDTQGLDVVPGSYIPVGNDGQHYNKNITDAPALPEGPAFASALILSSDHLPIRLDIQVPAKVLVTGGPLAFGTVIVGAAAQQDVFVSNPAVVPGDELDYTLAAPSGFSAPAGAFQVAAGGVASNAHTVSLDTAVPGIKAGNIAVNSEDLDTPVLNVAVSGTVLGHASASLDSLAALLATTLDFGVQDPGAFTPMEVRVHNLGYQALQAQLLVSTATITGGDGRFAITSGNTPLTLAGTGETYTVTFEDAGATRDSLYTGELRFVSDDEPLPGAGGQPDLVVTLQAKLTSTPVGVEEITLPTTTRLYAPYPNPFRGASTLRFDLAHPTSVQLAVFDLSGRRVRTFASGNLPAGSHRFVWDGADETGHGVAGGLYFVRVTGAGLPGSTARIALIR